MQQLQEENSDCGSQNALHEIERSGRFPSSHFLRLPGVSPKLAAQFFKGVALIVLLLCLVNFFLTLHISEAQNLSQLQQSQPNANFAEKLDNISHTAENVLSQQLLSQTQGQRSNQMAVDGMSQQLNSVTRLLFDFFYSSTFQLTGDFNCGGPVQITGSSIYRYEKSANQSENGRPCIWVMWTNMSPSMKVRLLEVNGEVTIFKNVENMTRVQTWATSSGRFKEIVINSNIAVVMFTPRSHVSSTNLSSDPLPRNVMEIGVRYGSISSRTADVSVTTLTANISGPLTIDETNIHGHDARSFTFIYPPAGRKVRVQVTLVNTEEATDFLQVSKYSNDTREFEFVAEFYGLVIPDDSVVNRTFEGYVNQPMLLYFHTDVSVVSEGYRATYSSTI